MKERLIKLKSKFCPNSYILTIISALLLTLSFPNFDITVFIFFALVPLFWALSREEESYKNVLKISLIFGIVHFSTLIYWIAYTLNRFGNIPWIGALFLLFLLSLYLSLYIFIFLLLSMRIKAFSEVSMIKGFLLGLIWVSCEFLRSTLLTGFPWGLIGYPLSSYLILLQIADLFGIWGLSFLVIIINYYFFYTFKNFISNTYKNKSFLVSQLLFGAFISAIFLYGFYAIKVWENTLKADHTHYSLAILQGNVPQEIKEAKQTEFSLQVYERLSWKALEKKPQFIFFPETALPFYFPHDREPSLKFITFLNRVREHLGGDLQNNPLFVFGTFRVNYAFTPPKVHNSLMIWDGNNIADIYDKEKLVPFGEYVPLVRYFPFLKRISVVSDILKPGESKNLRVYRGDLSFEIVPLICFESAFPQILVKRLRQGGDFVFIATNDAWFGKTSAPYQHFQMAVVRAVESRRYTIQAGNTGISGVINPLGLIETKSALEVEAIVLGNLKIISNKTFFVNIGYVFPFFALMISLLITVFYGVIDSKFRRK
ncbi:MAG: apolipoprotein N-acyltransferase [Caldimicrobium sp.]|nr:apolipoprotein N-acyltransferase [Caldimicrobium sp.]MCX7874413.1 apolipoprotein N-acyltransferase [Caldimicrobium sp.]MDW8094002.1 apolipoprotein N-acyltransferase [Caldimicrobium sp.]